ncbi:MAG: choice-of-anchor B family protein [Calditrichaeota bacterium]|nr:choice-of-anchor B family protein [Calditrichota bacterium]
MCSEKCPFSQSHEWPIRAIVVGFLLLFPVLTPAQIVKNVQIVGFLDLTHLSPGNTIGNVWGFCRNGREYAVVAITDAGVAIVDVTDPANPVEASFVPKPPNTDRLYYAQPYSKGYVYATMRPGPLQIIDVRDPYNAKEVGLYSQNFTEAYKPWVDELRERLYLIDTQGGPAGVSTIVLDISNPTQPVEVGTYGVGYHHIYVRNDTAYGFHFNKGVDVLDVSDPANIQLIMNFDPLLPKTHSGWLHDNGKYLTVDHEYAPGEGPDSLGGHLQIWDVSAMPASPTLLGRYYTSTNHTGQASLHHSYWYFDLIYMSYWTEGVRIVDASDPRNPVEVGVYDWEDPNVSGIYRGIWGVFPYLPSRYILASFRTAGLYVLDYNGDGPGIQHTPIDTAKTATSALTGEFTWINGAPIDASASFVYWRSQSGNSWNQTAVQQKSDSTYSFSIPIAPGISRIEYYIDVADTLGRRTRAPGLAPYLDWYETFISSDAALPVVMVTYTATVTAEGIQLVWETAAEVNHAGFDILRKLSGEAVFTVLSSYLDNPNLRGRGNATRGRRYAFLDQTVERGQTVFYLIRAIGLDGSIQDFGPLQVKYPLEPIPDKFQLLPNYPNPFNSGTRFRFQLPVRADGKHHAIQLIVYDINGRPVATVFQGELPPGEHVIYWDGRSNENGSIASGIYFAVLRAAGTVHIQKITCIR